MLLCRGRGRNAGTEATAFVEGQDRDCGAPGARASAPRTLCGFGGASVAGSVQRMVGAGGQGRWEASSKWEGVSVVTQSRFAAGASVGTPLSMTGHSFSSSSSRASARTGGQDARMLPSTGSVLPPDTSPRASLCQQPMTLLEPAGAPGGAFGRSDF